MRKILLWLLTVICLAMAGCTPTAGDSVIQDKDDIPIPTEAASETPGAMSTVPGGNPVSAQAPDKEDVKPAGMTIMLNNQPLTFTLGMTMAEAEHRLDEAGVRYTHQEDISTRRGWSGHTICIVDHGLLTFDIHKKQLHEIMIEYTQNTQTNLGLSFESGKRGMEELLGTDYTSDEDTIFEYDKGSYYIEVVIVLNGISSYGISQFSGEQYQSQDDVGNIKICADNGKAGTLHIGMECREALDLLKRLGIEAKEQEYQTDEYNPILKNCQRINAQGTALHFNAYGDCFKIDVQDRKTPEGLEIGDTAERVEELYGKLYKTYWLTDGNQRFEYIDGNSYFFVDFLRRGDGVNMQVNSWGYSRYQSDMWGQKASKPIINPEGVTMIKQPYNVPYFFDLDHDGDVEKITMSAEEGPYDLLLHVTDADGGDVTAEEVDGFQTNVYYCTNTQGELAILTSFDAASDDYVTKIYTFEGTTPIEKTVLPGYVTGADTHAIAAYDGVFVLGTWHADIEYTMNDAFMLIPMGDGLWHIDPEKWEQRVLTVEKEVPVQMLVDGQYIDDTLSVGTKLWPTATDRTSFVLFKTEDGREGKICFERRRGFLYIDGIHEDELFDGNEYSG